MAKPLTAFICGTFADLAIERQATLDALRRINQEHYSMEFFGANAAQPIDVCLQRVAASDVVIVILGHCYGSLVPNKSISFSEAEYREAIRLGKKCLIYIKSADVLVKPIHVERSVTKARKLNKWKNELSSKHTTSLFSDPNELAAKITADVVRLNASLITTPNNGDQRTASTAKGAKRKQGKTRASPLSVHVSTISKSIRSFTEMIELVDEDLRQDGRSLDLVKAILKEQEPWLRERVALLKRKGFLFSGKHTYMDLCNNIHHMVHVRQELVMHLEHALRQAAPSQEEINRACADIYNALGQLEMLILIFYRIAQNTQDERYLKLPIAMHKLMAETRVASSRFTEMLGYDGRNNHTSIFSDPKKRIEAESFCNEMVRMIDALCSIQLPVRRR